jgi:hypothetical protein
MNGLVSYVKSSENAENAIVVLRCFYETKYPKGTNLTRSLDTIIQSVSSNNFSNITVLFQY